MIHFLFNKNQFVQKGIFSLLFSMCFLWSEEIAYKELELELDLESRFLGRLERIVGKERVMLEVDITLEYKEVKSSEPQLSLRRVSGLPTRPAKLPGFARISQDLSEKKKDRKLEMTGMMVKLILDKKVWSKIFPVKFSLMCLAKVMIEQNSPWINLNELKNYTLESAKIFIKKFVSQYSN